MVTSRHEFLLQLHELLKPQTYLEIGVQHGYSLELAKDAKVAIGIDPVPLPLVAVHSNQVLYSMTADDYFETITPSPVIDLAFIDGSHLFEDALNDFMNLYPLCGPRSVVVFDDVLPYNQAIANREQPPGDWTGDVWKVVEILQGYFGSTNLNIHTVDTTPTGTMVVWGFRKVIKGLKEWRRVRLELDREDVVSYWTQRTTVPDYVINRSQAKSPEWIIESIRRDLCKSPSPEAQDSSEPPP
jgi:Methyltransferase domain